MRRIVIVMLLFGCATGLCDRTASGQIEYEVDNIMYKRPEFPPLPSEEVYPKRLVPLWQSALARPDGDLQRLIADALVGLIEEGTSLDFSPLIPELRRLLTAEMTPEGTRLAVARALVALRAEDAAEELLEQSQRSADMLASVVEPALGEWGDLEVVELWLQRVEDRQAPRTRLRLSLRGLAAVNQAEAIPAITAIVADPKRPLDVRLLAAESLGQLQTDGLLGLADAILREPTDRGPARAASGLAHTARELMAARLVRRHRDAAAVEVQQRMAQEFNGAAAAVAVQVLLTQDPELVIAIAEPLFASPDARVRQFCAQALFEAPTPERIGRLAVVMDDYHRAVRRSARGWLRQLDESEDPASRQAIRDGLVRLLTGDGWRGLEQASLLAGELEFKPAAERLVQLLNHEQPEVFVAAAWGLQRLEIPETLEPMFERALANKQQAQDRERAAQQQQLLQTFGVMRFAKASQLAWSYVPKNTPGPREAGIWALSQIHENDPPDGLVQELAERIADEDPMNPEMPEVKEMSAIAIGFLNGREAEETLRAYGPREEIGSRMGQCVAWALNRIFGEPIPPINLRPIYRSGWALSPITEDPAEYTRPRTDATDLE